MSPPLDLERPLQAPVSGSISRQNAEQLRGPIARAGRRPRAASCPRRTGRVAAGIADLAEDVEQILPVGVVRVCGRRASCASSACLRRSPVAGQPAFVDEVVVLHEADEDAGQHPGHGDLIEVVVPPDLETPGPCGHPSRSAAEGVGPQPVRRSRGARGAVPTGRPSGSGPAVAGRAAGTRSGSWPSSSSPPPDPVAVQIAIAAMAVLQPGQRHPRPLSRADQGHLAVVDDRQLALLRPPLAPTDPGRRPGGPPGRAPLQQVHLIDWRSPGVDKQDHLDKLPATRPTGGSILRARCSTPEGGGTCWSGAARPGRRGRTAGPKFAPAKHGMLGRGRTPGRRRPPSARRARRTAPRSGGAARTRGIAAMTCPAKERISACTARAAAVARATLGRALRPTARPREGARAGRRRGRPRRRRGGTRPRGRGPDRPNRPRLAFRPGPRSSFTPRPPETPITSGSSTNATERLAAGPGRGIDYLLVLRRRPRLPGRPRRFHQPNRRVVSAKLPWPRRPSVGSKMARSSSSGRSWR